MHFIHFYCLNRETSTAARQHRGKPMNNLVEHCNADKTWNKWGNKDQSISSWWIFINNSELMACKISAPNKQVSANQFFFLCICLPTVLCVCMYEPSSLWFWGWYCAVKSAACQTTTSAVIGPVCHQVSASRLSKSILFLV